MTNVTVYIPPKRLREIDSKRGDIPRSRFILRLLETSMKTYKKTGLEGILVSVDDSFSSKDQQTSVVGV